MRRWHRDQGMNTFNQDRRQQSGRAGARNHRVHASCLPTSSSLPRPPPPLLPGPSSSMRRILARSASATRCSCMWSCLIRFSTLCQLTSAGRSASTTEAPTSCAARAAATNSPPGVAPNTDWERLSVSWLTSLGREPLMYSPSTSVIFEGTVGMRCDPSAAALSKMLKRSSSNSRTTVTGLTRRMVSSTSLADCKSREQGLAWTVGKWDPGPLAQEWQSRVQCV